MPRPLPGEDAGGRKGAVTGTERLRPVRLQHGRVSAVSRRLQPPPLQPTPLRGSGVQALPLVRPAGQLPHPPASWEQAPGSLGGLTCPPYELLLASGKALPAAFDLEAAWLDVPRHVTLPALGLAPAPGVRSLPEPSRGRREPRMLLLLQNHCPCPHGASPLPSLGTSRLVSYPSPTWSGKVPPGQGLCPAFVRGWRLPRGRGPPPPWSPERGPEPWLCLASLAMRGNSQFPRELLSPGQPSSPNIYISHYCLHMSLFSGGVSSFPLLPQCSPCSISSGAAIPKAVLCSHYCLINLQGKAKLSQGSNPSHRARQPRERRDSPRETRHVAVGRGWGRTYFAA